jgi:hypothetical protein
MQGGQLQFRTESARWRKSCWSCDHVLDAVRREMTEIVQQGISPAELLRLELGTWVFEH